MLDPNIILQAQQPQIDNPLDTAQKAQSLRTAMNQNAIGDVAVTQAQRGESDEQQLRQAFQNNVKTNEDGTPTLDRKGVMQDLYKVAPEKAMALQSQWTANDVAVQKAQRENEKVAAETQGIKIKNHMENLKTANEQVDRMKNYLGTSIDQISYSANRAQAISEGIPGAEKMPELFDPNFVKSQLQGAAGAKTTLENATKQAELQLQTAQFGNTVRHQGFEENLSSVNAGRQQFNANRESAHRIIDEYLHLPIVEKTFPVIKENYDKLQALGKKGGLSDIGLMDGILRMYNPGVSVRQGTFDLASAKAMGIPDKIISKAEALVNGGVLDASVRSDLLKEAERIYKVQEGAVGDISRQYKERLTKEGLNPELLPDITSTGGVSGPGSGNQGGVTKTISSAEVEAMSKNYGKSVSQIVADFRAKGYRVQ